MEPNLREISHILVADIKSLFTNISHDLVLKALEYWVEKLQHKIEHLQKSTKNFILEGMSIILKYDYFYIDCSFIRQIKGTAMDTHVAVVYANLTCGYLEVKLFNKLP